MRQCQISLLRTFVGGKQAQTNGGQIESHHYRDIIREPKTTVSLRKINIPEDVASKMQKM